MKVYHVDAATTPKHVENSIRGIRYAKRHGFDAIDLDMLMDRAGQAYGCHWDRPMLRDGFRDPLRQIHPDTLLRRMTGDEVRRLVAGWVRRYRIVPIETLIAECARLGVIALLEPKDDPRLWTPTFWEHIAQVGDRTGCHIQMYALPQNSAAIKAAEAAGIHGWEIEK